MTVSLVSDSITGLFDTRSESVAAQFNFAKEEEKVIQFWREIDAFETSLKLTEGKPEFIFYDGPPFATGLPHYGERTWESKDRVVYILTSTQVIC